MVPQSRLGRTVVVLAGALFGGGFAALASVWLPGPYPLAVGISVAVPVMDLGLYPKNVPDDRHLLLTVGVLAALGGTAVSFAVGAVWTTLSLPWAIAFPVGSAYLGAQAAGRVALSRLN